MVNQHNINIEYFLEIVSIIFIKFRLEKQLTDFIITLDISILIFPFFRGKRFLFVCNNLFIFDHVPELIRGSELLGRNIQNAIIENSSLFDSSYLYIQLRSISNRFQLLELQLIHYIVRLQR